MLIFSTLGGDGWLMLVLGLCYPGKQFKPSEITRPSGADVLFCPRGDFNKSKSAELEVRNMTGVYLKIFFCSLAIETEDDSIN